MKKLIALLALALLTFSACTPKEQEKVGEIVNPQEIVATAIELSSHNLTLEKGANAILTVTYAPSDVTKKDITWVSSNTSIATVNEGIVVGVETGEAEIIAKCGEAVDRCKVLVVIIPDGAVNLGLTLTRADGTPYTLYWAKYNLSESGLCANPEDYGDYYAWGETEPYYTSQDPLTWKSGKESGYNFRSYKWCNGSYDSLTKYNNDSSHGVVDSKTSLDPKDDAAHVKLGGNWRIPTDEEWKALSCLCEWTWTTKNGVNGMIVKGPNGNSIFFPAPGSRRDTYLDASGSYGLYWSSSLSTIYPTEAYIVYFRADGVYESYVPRCLGRSIRPVTE